MVEFKKAKLKHPRGSQYVVNSHIGKVHLKKENDVWYICREKDSTRFNQPHWSTLEPSIESVSWFFGYWFTYKGLNNRSTNLMLKIK